MLIIYHPVLVTVVNVQTKQPPPEQGLGHEGKGHEAIPPHDHPGPAKVLPRLQGPDQTPEERGVSAMPSRSAAEMEIAVISTRFICKFHMHPKIRPDPRA